MSEILTTSIVLYGTISEESQKWLEWYDYCLNEFKLLNFEPNFVGITGESFNSGKVLSRNRIEKKLIRCVANNEKFTSIGLFSLPPDFKQAAFDYDIYLSRVIRKSNSHIIFTIKSEYFNKLSLSDVRDELKDYLNFESGQVFEMTNYESPKFYAARVNPDSTYKTLRIIEEF